VAKKEAANLTGLRDGLGFARVFGDHRAGVPGWDRAGALRKHLEAAAAHGPTDDPQ
jgi:hypothetical protein